MKTAKYLFLAAAAIAFAACSNDEDGANNGPVEAKVSASFGAESRDVNTDNTWTEGDAIGVMATNAPVSARFMTDRYKNVKYTADAAAASSAFSAETGKGIFFQYPRETVTFAAYYPYQPSAADALPGTDGVITVNTENYNLPHRQASIDFLFASGATASKDAPGLSFSGDHQFKHCMAQLNLVITASTNHGFTPEEAESVVRSSMDAAGAYKLGGLIHEGTFNVTDGTTSLTGAVVDNWDLITNVHSVKSDPSTDTFILNYPLILLPQDKRDSPLNLQITISGGAVYTNTTDIAPNLEAGKKYTYTITLKKTGMTVSGCTIAPWEEGITGSGDATM